VPDFSELLRQPLGGDNGAQAHVIAANVKLLDRQKCATITAEMGTGKTFMGMVVCHKHARGRGYRGLVFCPGQLTRKWARELRETIPDVEVRHIEDWHDAEQIRQITQLHGHRPTRPVWYIVSRDRAKLGSKWRPAYTVNKRDKGAFLRCPQCGRPIVTEKGKPLVLESLEKKPSYCRFVLDGDVRLCHVEDGCGAPLWTVDRKLHRIEPAKMLHKARRGRRRGVFQYLIVDEIHEEKSADSAQANAVGSLIAASEKVVALSGTYTGGFAEHVRPLLFRMAPHTLLQEGLTWKDVTPFSQRYGRIETRVVTKQGGSGDSNRASRGRQATTKTVRPGIVPTLYGKHLLDKTTFLSLTEFAEHLPSYEEQWPGITMDPALATAYEALEKKLRAAIKDLMFRGERRLLSTMLQALLAYPDHPYDWEPLGYMEDSEFITVAIPDALPRGVLREKERFTVDTVIAEVLDGRKCWVYVQNTQKRDVQGRLVQTLREAGLRVESLRSSAVKLDDREAWIEKKVPQVDVIVSHPQLVATGLDLIQFPTLIFHQVGYNPFTMRQASRRAWRIGQKRDCRTYYTYYADTMQATAVKLMRKKLEASLTLEGKFDFASDDDDQSMELALAKALLATVPPDLCRRQWRRIESNESCCVVL
jgi:hypothetical protein